MKKLGLLLAMVMLLGACASPAPEATPTPTSIPVPTNTPGLLATPTPSARTETTFVEPIRRQIFDELVDAQGGISGNEEARATVAQQWGISVDAAEEIILEGLEKGWLMPTVTPIPPTATSIPPTATPGISPQERAYALEIIELLEEYADLSDKISVLQDQASKDTALFSDERWLQDVSIIVAAMQRCGQRIRELVPPVRFEEAHQDLVEATRHHDHANALFMQGVEELNPDKVLQALLELKLANQYMARSNVKLKPLLQP